MLLDRSGQGKVYNLITRRRFLQMDVLEGLNVLVTISGQLAAPGARGPEKPDLATLFFRLAVAGKKNKLRVYYLSWLRNRILHNDPEVEKKQGWITVGDLEGCVHYKVGKDLNLPPGLSIHRCVCGKFRTVTSHVTSSLFLTIWATWWKIFVVF